MSSALVTLNSFEELQSFISTTEYTIICFSAKWCGPCKKSHPQLIDMSNKLSSKYGSTLLQTGIVYEDVLGQSIHNYSIRAFPTYLIYSDYGRNEIGRIQGVNFVEVERLISEHIGNRTAWKEQPGHSLGGGGAPAVSAQETRLARLAALEKKKPVATTTTAATDLSSSSGGTSTSKVEKENGKQVSAAAATAEEEAEATTTTTTAVSDKMINNSNSNNNNSSNDNPNEDAVMKDTVTSTTTATEESTITSNKMDIDKPTTTTESDVECIPVPSENEVVDPFKDLNEEYLKELTDNMGFPKIRAQKGLLYGTNGTVEGAVEWIMNHQDDIDIDEVPKPVVGTVMKSYKCNDCGKILSNMANLELHANKTGHSDFAESTEEALVLTPEQKAAKLNEIKDLLAKKRAERERKEKEDEKEREKRRRFQGQEMSKTREMLEIEQRRRDADAKRREKIAAKKERERIKAELEKDKRERLANKGKLKSKLGIDGYNPDAIQYDNNNDNGEEQEHEQQQKSEKDDGKCSPATTKKKVTAPSHLMKIDDCITKISSYRAGGDGEKCLKLLLIFIKNIVEHPTEQKYRSINMDGKAYKSKIKPFQGAKQLLVNVGFSYEKDLHLQFGKDTDGNEIEEKDIDMNILKETKMKLEQAIERY